MGSIISSIILFSNLSSSVPRQRLPVGFNDSDCHRVAALNKRELSICILTWGGEHDVALQLRVIDVAAPVTSLPQL
jgi:hypothetical protein